MTQRDELEQKDRLGDKLRDAEKAREDQFFADLDKKLLEKLREKQRERAQAGVLACPRCGQDLVPWRVRGAEAHRCGGCGGLWLDKEAADRLGRDGQKKGLLARLLGTGTGGES